MIIETIHNILLVLTDNNDQTNSTRILLLEQLGQLSRMLTLMIKINNEDNLDLVGEFVFLEEKKYLVSSASCALLLHCILEF